MGQKKILVADSGETSRKALCEALNNLGYWTFQATDGSHTLRLARKLKPDLVILDTGLWGMPPGEVANIIETDGLSTVLFISGHITPAFLSQLRNRYVYAYITKPVQTKQLKQMLDIALVHSEKLTALHQRIHRLEQKLLHQQQIRQAKEILMVTHGYGESEAYHYLRKLAMESRQTIDQIAVIICSDKQK